MNIDPRTYRISPHFILSDFLGNHSVYARGYANNVEFQMSDMRLENAKALCIEGLEPLLEAYGPLSISYGLISPELSKKIVAYQDPGKPSHHRFDLGAACDICVHKWIAGDYPTMDDLYLPDSVVGSPIALAHAIDLLDIPYSRLITYSESPYVCLALSAIELVRGTPRKAFYENRYLGAPKEKPEYIQYSSNAAKRRALARLQEDGLECDWAGAGYPTYHGGGFRQLQHTRVSRYTMLSDWLFDLQSISNGAKNVPAMQLETVQDALAAAGIVYDWMLEVLTIPRMSIVAGYVSHQNRYFDKDNDWRSNVIFFEVVPPDCDAVMALDLPTYFTGLAFESLYFETTDEGFLRVSVDVAMVLDEPDEVWNV